MKRAILPGIAVLLGLAAVPAFADEKTAERPNIVFILADDWGWGDLGCHGHPWLKTPNLDKLASEGIDFRQFTVASPVCSPSRAAILTGLYPARLCIHQHFSMHMSNANRGMPDWLDPRVATLPRLLQSAGYRTAHFGKWHLCNDETDSSDAPSPKDYGYDVSAVFDGPGPQTDYTGLFDKAIDFIKTSKGRPFFLNIAIHETHTPHRPSEDSMKKWEKLEKRNRVYASVVTDGDAAIGRVLDTLKSEGLVQNTLVIFTSDNGPEWTGGQLMRFPIRGGGRGYGMYYSVGSTAGMRGRKRSLFEGGVRTPLIVRWPGHAPAGVTNETTVVTAVDFLPTLCAAAGVAPATSLQPDGENLLAAFNGGAIKRTKPVFWEWQGTDDEPDWWPRLAVRDGDWKLAMTCDKKRIELHNLASDVAEKTNLATNHPDIVARLSALALEWKATLPATPPDFATTTTNERPTAPAAVPR